MVDLCIIGAGRTTATSDVANKIGSYLKVLTAHTNEIPFLVALPSSTINWMITDGSTIPIEERAREEVNYVTEHSGKIETVPRLPQVRPPTMPST